MWLQLQLKWKTTFMLIGLLCVKKFNINEKCSINLQFYSVRRQLDVILTILQKMYASNMITITAGISKTEEGIQIATNKAKKKRTHHHIEAFLPMNKQARSTWAKKRETALYISPNKPHANTASGKIRKNACYTFSGAFFHYNRRLSLWPLQLYSCSDMKCQKSNNSKKSIIRILNAFSPAKPLLDAMFGCAYASLH